MIENWKQQPLCTKQFMALHMYRHERERGMPLGLRSIRYLYEDCFRIVVCHGHPLQHGETDCETVLQSLHFYCQALLLLCSNICSKLPGVVLQLSVSELIEGSHVRQLPFSFHQQRQMLRTHIFLWQWKARVESFPSDIGIVQKIWLLSTHSNVVYLWSLSAGVEAPSCQCWRQAESWSSSQATSVRQPVLTFASPLNYNTVSRSHAEAGDIWWYTYPHITVPSQMCRYYSIPCRIKLWYNYNMYNMYA